MSLRSVMQSSNPPIPGLDLRRVLAGRRLVVVGGTGFLGKVWWTFMLHHFPEIARIHLLVRPRGKLDAERRFWDEIAPSACLDALRSLHGASFEAFLRDKVVPIAGDVVKPFCGLEPGLRDELRGAVDVVVNASGVVDFDPPLDEALEVNAFGVQNLVSLARDLGELPLLHTSTTFVAGNRTGFIQETDPREHPFPRAGELAHEHWDPDREISECLDVIEQARHRANDAFRQSRFLDEAKKSLLSRGEPTRGAALEAETLRVKRKFVEARLAEMGMERANFWGFPNTYTYTKAIGEQIVAGSGLPFTIVRPAIVESTVRYPFPGWNEGINTSAPLIYSLREGQLQIPGGDNYLDFIPCDMVAGAMTLSLAELLEGSAPAVYQYASSDSNPCTMRRFFELSGLYKREYWQRTGRGGPIVSYVQAHFEGALVDKQTFERFGPLVISKGLSGMARWLGKAARGPAAPLLEPTKQAIEAFSLQQQKVGEVLSKFVPFTAEYDYVFRCDHTRRANQRLSDEQRAIIGWQPEAIDWRQWFLRVHVPGLEKWVFPQIDQRLRRVRRAPQRHETLPALLSEMAERHSLAVALQRTEADGLSRISFAEWQRRSLACAHRLALQGVERGDRVLLAGSNHPAWAISFFGILLAGATAVPLDANVDARVVDTLAGASGAKLVLADPGVRQRVGHELESQLTWLDLFEAASAGEALAEPAQLRADEVAALIYTSGTTGTPKGVMLSHENLTALVAALAPLFPLGTGDRVLSVLPLHHTFELTCGMLLPLSRGARIVYLDELTAERLEHGLRAGRITAMVGVPALWEMIERRLYARLAEHGKLASHVFEAAVELNRALGKTLGIDAGKLLFGPVHEALGGHLRYLVSGGAALPERTHHVFAGMGLHLAEGYGLTEAAPVLTVARAGTRSRPGHVGKPVPGVEIRIASPNAEGVGEVLARGPNVMLGYSDDPESTSATIGADGWLHTGDLGKLDKHANLVIVGRAKDVIVASNGENVHPDDVEARLGQLEQVAELGIFGIGNGRGGERVACVAVPANHDRLPRAERHARAKQSLEHAFTKLPAAMRPAVLTLIDTPLPRTTTRKLKRSQLRALVERVAPLSDRPPRGLDPEDAASARVRAAVAAITRRAPATLHAGLTLRGDLGFDSLMLLELLVALEAQLGAALDAERLSAATTLGDVESLLRDTHPVRAGSASEIERSQEQPLELPPVVRDAAMHWLGRAQAGFYERVLQTTVTGRAFIPHNRNSLVAANHASHLDMGLVKYALGSYGQRLVSLAAKDYFFEGNRWRKAYFENFTNLVPISRAGSLRQSLRQAGELIEKGETLLIFPEGTRTSGEIEEFKPAVGYLALQHGVDVLPIYLGGTAQALPKGATVLRRRDVVARIGPPLEVEHLRRLTRGMTPTEASRAAAALVRRAVLALARGEVLDITRIQSLDQIPAGESASLEPVFRELATRFLAGSVEQPVSFYFSLGNKERWTVKIDRDTCQVLPGKIASPADCVLKTSPDMFTRIVREAYTPSPAEFMSGAVKSNNIGLLMTFQKAFRLAEAAQN
jgi:long-chain acyl-CoA synthetase